MFFGVSIQWLNFSSLTIITKAEKKRERVRKNNSEIETKALNLLFSFKKKLQPWIYARTTPEKP